MNYWRGKRALITGGSAGLGLAVARTLAKRGAAVAIAARGQQALDTGVEQLREHGGKAIGIAADVTCQSDVDRLRTIVLQELGGIDLVCHAAGRSMRGTLLSTPIQVLQDFVEINSISALRCAQAFASSLEESRGHLVLIGSLASKTAAGYLGAYPASKFPLAAIAQQLRIETVGTGLHTLLVCPGPIARDEKPGTRYADQIKDVPAAAQQPGGGARVKAIDPIWLSKKILSACERRQAELIVPSRARLLFALSQLSPRCGDWLLKKMTS